MNAEVLTEVEFQPSSDEVVVERETSSAEFPCENKLGYTALCASCYLVKFLGDCPKNIREKAVSPEASLAETDDPLLLGFDADIFSTYTPFISEEVSAVLEIPAESANPVVITPSVEVKVPVLPPQPEHPAEDISTIVEPERPQPRSYLDLLMDDSIEVVVAAPKPFVKKVEAQPPLPEVSELEQVPVIESLFDEPLGEAIESAVAPPKVVISEAIPVIELTEVREAAEPVEPVMSAIAPREEPAAEDVLGSLQELSVANLQLVIEEIVVPHLEEIPEEGVETTPYSPQEKSNVYTIDFLVSEDVEPPAIPLQEVVQLSPESEPAIVYEENDLPPLGEAVTTMGPTPRAEEALPFSTPLRVEEPSAPNDDRLEVVLPFTPERLFPTVQKYSATPFRYTRSFIGAFALLTLVFVDHSS